MGEEAGSPGLHAFCEQRREALKAQLLIACDGPRVAREHLDAAGFGMVGIAVTAASAATRLDVRHPWVDWAREGLQIMGGLYWDLGEPAGLPWHGPAASA